MAGAVHAASRCARVVCPGGERLQAATTRGFQMAPSMLQNILRVAGLVKLSSVLISSVCVSYRTTD